MIELNLSEAILEIAGPRGQIYRPALDRCFQEARALAEAGRYMEAMRAAEDAQIAREGNCFGVTFRVVVKSTRYIGIADKDRLLHGVPIADTPPTAEGGQEGVECGCRVCLKGKREPMSGLPVEMTRMILCPTCGNKRCPHANDHRNPCTGSNDPDQPGSAY